MTEPQSVTELLQMLIRIPSVNPDGAPDQGATGEAEMARAVGGFLERCGAIVRYEDVLPNRPNVIGSFPHHSENTAPGLLFAPHTDTVSVQGMTIPPFDATLSDGKIHGRGASDTKGTMAAMLWACYELRDDIPNLSTRVSFVGLMGEEAGQPGSKHFAEHHAREYAFAIVGEPTELDIVYAHKGCVWLELSTTGHSCHGSAPELGDNAILKLAPLLGELIERINERLPNYHDSVLGIPTVSLGKINGGTSANIVPAKCSAILDFRETPSLQRDGGCVALVSDILASLGAKDTVSLRIVGDSVPLCTDTRLDPIVRLQSLGADLTTAPWFCDAGRLAEVGLPAIACGPGSIAQAHTKDEFIAIDNLEAGVEFFKQFLLGYASA